MYKCKCKPHVNHLEIVHSTMQLMDTVCDIGHTMLTLFGGM